MQGNIDEKNLWTKISGSINHYLRYCNKRMSDEELVEDYVECKCQYIFV